MESGPLHSCGGLCQQNHLTPVGWDAYENAAAYQKYSGTKDVGHGTDHFHLRTNAGAEKKSFF